MPSSEPASQKRPPSRDEDTDVDRPPSDRSERAAEVSRDTDELLEDIDDLLLATLGLDRDASNDEFEEMARAQVASYVQKGGE